MLFAIGKSDFLWKRFQRIIGAWLKVKGFDLLKIGIVGLVYGANPLIKTSSWLRALRESSKRVDQHADSRDAFKNRVREDRDTRPAGWIGEHFLKDNLPVLIVFQQDLQKASC